MHHRRPDVSPVHRRTTERRCMDAKLIQSLLDEHAKSHLEDIRAEVSDSLVAEGVTSPIEWIMAYALKLMDGFCPWQVSFVTHFDGLDACMVQVLPQLNVTPYRVDFALKVRGPDRAHLYVVECDGHAYHEKTKQQAAHDKRRDRFLQRAGWKVLRFTGSEICGDPQKCAQEVSDQIWEDIAPRKKVVA